MIWYKTNGFNNRIVKVEVERSTDKSVWIEGRRHDILSSWERYYPTVEEAIDSIHDYYNGVISGLKARIEITKADREKFKDWVAENIDELKEVILMK